jgi:integrase
MKNLELKGDKIIKDWITIIDARPTTVNNYLFGMQVYTEWTGKTPKVLLAEARKEIKKPISERRLKIDLAGFRRFLQDNGLAPLSVKAYMTGVISFYSAYDISIPNIRNKKAKGLQKNKDIPTKEDIQDCLKVADVFERALVLVGTSSGLAEQEITNLTVNDIKKGYDPETEITTLELRRIKEEVDFITFLSPEASRAVWAYLEYRNRTDNINDQRIKQLEKQKVYSDDGYLFIKRKVSDSYLETHNEEERKLNRPAFMKIYREISTKARKNTPKGDWNLIRSHNVRKYYNSCLYNAGADSFFVEYTMGHTLDDTRAAYFRAVPADMKKIYQKYIPYLTIEKNLDVSESPEFQKLKSENEILAREAVRATVERSEIQKLRDEIEKIKGLTDGSTELLQLLRGNPEAIEIMKNMKSQQKST